jgi:phosphonoacetaldehyde hydrolase
MTGNAVGLSEAELATRDPVEQFLLRTAAARTLEGAGAHYVIDGVADLMPVMDEIESRLASGERPPQPSGS